MASSGVDLRKEQFLQEVVEDGFQLESGIEEVVVMLNLNGIRTSQSCEGHLETEGADIAIPWQDLIEKRTKWLEALGLPLRLTLQALKNLHLKRNSS